MIIHLLLTSIGWLSVARAENRTIVVAVVDTGIELTHPALASSLWTNELEKNGQVGVDDDGNGYVDDVHGFNFVDQKGDSAHQTINDHGTHVAGLVLQGFQAAQGQQVKLMAVNVYGSQVFGSPLEALNEGVRYAARMGADVINISATSPGTSVENEAAIRDAVTWGSLIVTAAGNESTDLDQSQAFPASYGARYPEVISVAATDKQTGSLCQKSSYGANTVLIAAPGCDRTAPNGGIRSTRRGGTFGYKSGTSMAAPFVAGWIAAWLERRHGAKSIGSDVREWLASVATPSPELEGRVRLGGVLPAAAP
jgi:thermitase